MIYSILLLAATTSLVSAQNYSTSGPLTIDPNGIPYDTRLSWCRAQTASCPLICGDDQAYPNTCMAQDLTYTCTCTNGNKPNISNYDQTIPSFVCNTWIANCVDAHMNDLTGITACRSVICGMANASSADSSSSSSMSASATASSTGGSGGAAGGAGASSSPTGSASGSSGSSQASATASGSAASASSSTGAAAAMGVAKNYGTGILATGLLALFGLAL